VHLGEKIGVREGSKSLVPFENLSERLSERSTPSWLMFDGKSMQGGMQTIPTVVSTDTAGDLVSVISFYSR
jgi:hypothetical protein